MDMLVEIAAAAVADKELIIVDKDSGNAIDYWYCAVEWSAETPLIGGRNYALLINDKIISSYLVNIKFKYDELTKQKLVVSSLEKSEYGTAVLSLPSCEEFLENTKLECVIGDEKTLERVGRIVFLYRLRRAANVSAQPVETTREIRSAQKEQIPLTVWFSGLSGSGKSTLANALEVELVKMGKHTMLLDGDNVRLGLNRDLGFTEADRIENIRRVVEVARLLNDAGLIVLASFITPFEKDREYIRSVLGASCIEVYVATPLDVCEQRDVKGLYAKARAGEIPNFTGVTASYEVPHKPDCVIDTSQISLKDAVNQLLSVILHREDDQVAV